jgi:hypothetical protein
MKERDSKLQEEMDTDDEDYEVTEGSFVAPRGTKRKRTESEVVDEPCSSKRKETCAESTDKPSSETSEVPIPQASEPVEGAVGTSTETTESSDSQQRRGVMGTLFPFLM